jgi:prepilin-type N-terminal cleavage/methylation domain-containing protein
LDIELQIPARNSQGVTLIEMIIVIILLGIVAGIGAAWMIQGLKANLTSVSLQERSWQARLSLERMSLELHSLHWLDPNSNTSVINFTNVNFVPVNYKLSGVNLLRNNVTMATNVTSVLFNYVDSNYNLQTSPSTNTICIYMYANISSNKASMPLQTIICPSNL